MRPPPRVYDNPNEAPRPDPLLNLSTFSGTCRCCGRHEAFSSPEDVPVKWVVCGCGHVYPLARTNRWH